MLTQVRRIPLPAVLRQEPQFRLLFGSQVLSILGDRVTAVALPFAVLASGGGVADVALVSAAQFLPFVVLALPAGVWADRWDRKTILIASDLVRLVCQLVAATLLLGGGASIPALVAIAAVYGAADAFFAPAFSGLLPSTVSPVNLQPANALRGLSFSFGSVAGPIVAGVLIAVMGGPGWALLFDALTFAVSIALLLPLRPRLVQQALHEEDPTATTDHFLTSLVQGWREVRSRPWVTGFLGSLSVYHLAVLPAIFVIGPVLMERELDGARSWAVIVTCFGVGAVLGDILFLRWRPRYAMRVASLLLVGASCQAAFIGSGLGTWAIGGLEVLAGICVTGAFTLWETSLGEHIPDQALSRVSSYDYLASNGSIPLGNLLAGAASAAYGLHSTLVGMTVIGVGVSLAVAALPAVRNLPRATAEPTAAVPQT
ncbi:MFS transporter [Nocardioides sp.]|uniref:MFS transporter n=1 Tax=Nocardioides sp. TaxID=35761 RepID=UPI001A2B586F|nr:MFS transporter [Nocardioides sp.]MBJ7356083.1 MFS transporter [Nocardioides sp.]